MSKQAKAGSYIRAIARFQSISAAAEELGISQPALSTYLKKKEEQVGDVIIDRSKTPFTLTEVGKAFLAFEDAQEELERDFARKVSDIRNLKSGSLVIGGAASFNAAFLPPAITAFSNEFPGVDIQIVDDTVPNLETRALAGEIDVFLTPETKRDEFDYARLLEERAFLCVPAEWPVASELPQAGDDGLAPIGEDGLRALEAHPFIMLHGDQQIGKMMQALLDLHGIRPERIIFAEQTLTSFALTLGGAGVSLATEGTLGDYRRQNKYRLFVPEGIPASRTLYAATPRNRFVSNAAREFTARLKASIDERGGVIS